MPDHGIFSANFKLFYGRGVNTDCRKNSQFSMLQIENLPKKVLHFRFFYDIISLRNNMALILLVDKFISDIIEEGLILTQLRDHTNTSRLPRIIKRIPRDDSDLRNALLFFLYHI